MRKELFKKIKLEKKIPQSFHRFWGLAKKLEHRRVKGKQNN